MTTLQQRHGNIDTIDMGKLDLIELNGGVNPWKNAFVEKGFNLPVNTYRAIVEDSGIAGLGQVADLGAGYGRWSIFLAEVNGSVRGYERNDGAVALGNKLAAFLGLDNLQLETADIERLSAEDQSLDGIWCYNTLQFVNRGKCLAEIARMLRPGGVVYIGAYNGVGRVLEKFFQGYAAGGYEAHTTRFAMRSLRQGPLFNEGGANYGSPDHVREIVEEFGLTFDESKPIEIEMSRKKAEPTPFDAELSDLQALGAKLEGDAEFAAAFAAHPGIAYGFPMNIGFRCIRKS